MFTCDNCVHRYVCADWVKETHYDKFPLTAETEEELCEFYDEENTIIKYIPSDDTITLFQTQAFPSPILTETTSYSLTCSQKYGSIPSKKATGGIL